MKSILTSFLILISLQAMAIQKKSFPCKIHRTDGMVMYGDCIKLNSEVVFRSCLDFVCKVSQNLTRPLDNSITSCDSKSYSKILDLIHEEFRAEKFIPYCDHGK